MSDLRQAAQMALNALEANKYAVADQAPHRDVMEYNDAIERLRAALAEQPAEQEPFGYLWPTGAHPEFRFTQQERSGVDGMPVYTAPQPDKC